MEVEIDVLGGGRTQRVYSVSGAVHDGCDRAKSSASLRSSSSFRDMSQWRDPFGE
jgi:hypothetical protein